MNTAETADNVDRYFCGKRSLPSGANTKKNCNTRRKVLPREDRTV